MAKDKNGPKSNRLMRTYYIDPEADKLLKKIQLQAELGEIEFNRVTEKGRITFSDVVNEAIREYAKKYDINGG